MVKSVPIGKRGRSRWRADGGRRSLLAAQLCLAISGMGWLLLVPPASGPMMLVPLTPTAARVVPQAALTGENRLLGEGPLPGSMVVYGQRSTLAWRMLKFDILTVASDARGCSLDIPR